MLLGTAKNEALKPLKEAIKGVGALEALATAAVTWSGAPGKILKASGAHGLTTGMLIWPSALGGGAGLLAERPYWVKEVSSTEIEISQTVSFVAEEWTTSVTSATFLKLAEIPETRASCEFEAAAKGKIVDKTTRTIAVTSACSYEFIGHWTATSAGTLYNIAKVVKETLASAGSIEVRESQIDMLGGA